jgi:hypothetical protein
MPLNRASLNDSAQPGCVKRYKAAPRRRFSRSSSYRAATGTVPRPAKRVLERHRCSGAVSRSSSRTETMIAQDKSDDKAPATSLDRCTTAEVTADPKPMPRQPACRASLLRQPRLRRARSCEEGCRSDDRRRRDKALANSCGKHPTCESEFERNARIAPGPGSGPLF